MNAAKTAEVFYAAVSATYGIVVSTSDRDKIYKKFQLFIRTNLEEFSGLEVHFSPISETDLWIVKKNDEVVNG